MKSYVVGLDHCCEKRVKNVKGLHTCTRKSILTSFRKDMISGFLFPVYKSLVTKLMTILHSAVVKLTLSGSPIIINTCCLLVKYF